ncbi:hypothetical protein [Amycolatopsis sp. MtRt-6]|uniref:hypothetical protein n=1 Tax=Amycolatopsis sp. MtRt-6 TaxID=2792782 RepID=UPI001A8CF53E|nr:hypothetical protein [Amycolatopsis sp. MtRt-6]
MARSADEQAPGDHLTTFFQRVRDENGAKSLRQIGAAMLLDHVRVSKLLKGTALPVSVEQARDLARALGGGTDEQDTAERLFRAAKDVTAQARLHSVERWRPSRLGVHRAISIAGADGLPDLTPYVERPHDRRLRGLLSNLEQPLFAVLVGESCTGKTRAMLEAVRACLPTWPIVRPTGPADLVRASRTVTARSVLWLNETQHYLDGGRDEVVDALLRVLDSAEPVVVLGSMWRAGQWDRFTRRGATESPRLRDLLLEEAVRIDVATDFSDPVAAGHLAKQTDPRLVRARKTSYRGRVIQVLAGGRDLTDRYDGAAAADSFWRALVTAAMDANRLGVPGLIDEEFLREAAVAYLSPAERVTEDGRLPRALLEARTPNDFGISAFAAERHRPGTGPADHYALHDFLAQHGHTTRAHLPIPGPVWDVLRNHAHHQRHLEALGKQAVERGLYGLAGEFYRRAAGQGSFDAADRLADLLEASSDDAKITAFTLAAEGGDPASMEYLADELRAADRKQDAYRWLARAADAGSIRAPYNLAVWYDEDGDSDTAEKVLAMAIGRADAEDDVSLECALLARLLADRGETDASIDVWRSCGDVATAACEIADLLEEAGRVDEAVSSLRETLAADLASEEHETVLERLLSLLAEDGRHDEIGAVVREAARSPDRRVRVRAAELLGKRGDWSGAAASWQADADRGDPAAQLALANALVQLDRTDEAETWLRRASTSGDLTAASRLGALLHAEGRTAEAVLLWGKTVLPDGPWATLPTWWALRELKKAARTDEALAWLEHALRASDRTAFWIHDLTLWLGRCNRLEEAVRLWQPLAEAGDTHAARVLADLLAQGQRRDEARQWREWAAARGDAMAVAELVADSGDEPAEWLASAAEHGSLLAMSRLAETLRGAGRFDEAKVWQDRAADAGVPAALRLFADEADAEEDTAMALSWARRSVEADLSAWHNASRAGGFFVGLDPGIAHQARSGGRAEEWLPRAETGDVEAMWLLSHALADVGLPRQAETWRQRACETPEALARWRERAENGSELAVRRLAELLVERGQDAEAERWLRRAVECGDTPALVRLAEVLRGVGRAAEADAMLRFGLTPGGDTATGIE